MVGPTGLCPPCWGPPARRELLCVPSLPTLQPAGRCSEPQMHWALSWGQRDGPLAPGPCTLGLTICWTA